jgi:hypothetical protein
MRQDDMDAYLAVGTDVAALASDAMAAIKSNDTRRAEAALATLRFVRRAASAALGHAYRERRAAR